nr:NACHT domain-containing protein [Actinomadura bangladeshensis]
MASAVVLWASAGSGQPDPGVLADRAVTGLRGAVRRQWEHEAVVRRLRQPLPLQVEWSSTGRPVAADREVVIDEPGVTWQDAPLAGDTIGVVAGFRALERRQLVVIGEPGAGKSVLALLLTLGLLENFVEDEPVPVLLPVAAWDPRREGVAQWAARRLAEDYPAMAGSGDRQAVAVELMDQGRVLLILDGLDELASGLHATAVRKLDEYAATGRHLVVTCRSREYEKAIQTGGRILSRAAVVEIQPVTPGQAIAFLGRPATSRPRWAEVFTILGARPDGVLAKVLSTPLMVSLAYAAYQSPGTDPGELARADSRNAIQGKLMDTYIASVHDPDQPAAPISKSRYRPDAARRYLETLALHLDLSGTVEYVWWQLRPDLYTRHTHRAPALLSAGLTAMAGLAAIPPLGVRGGLCTTLVVGMALAVTATGMLRPVWPHNHPAYQPTNFRPARSRRRRVRFTRSASGAWCGLLTGLAIGDGVFATICGIAAAIIMPLVPTTGIKPHPRTATPTATVRSHHRATLAAAAQYAAAGAAIMTLTSIATGGPLSRTAVTAAVAALFYGWTAACPGGLWTWLRYRATHLNLLSHGRLPARLRAFLEDQHQRGTLRQTGTTWQIRHLILQHHLADTANLRHLRARAAQDDRHAARLLAELLTREGRTGEAITVLRARADQGDRDAARELVGLLAREGRTGEAITFLRPLADRIDGHSDYWWLFQLLAREGRTDELHRRADQGDYVAAWVLAEWLAQEGRAEEAIAVLRARVEQDPQGTTWGLVDLLAQEGRTSEAITFLRGRADQGDRAAAWRLADLLAEEGRAEEAIAVLRARVEQAPEGTTWRLARLLAQEGRTGEAIAVLRARAEQGDGNDAMWLADLLAQEGRIDELRVRADQGDVYASGRLVQALAREGRVDELRARADQGDDYAARELAELLAREGRTGEAIAVLRARADQGEGNDAMRLADLLAQEGRTGEAITVLRAQADQGVLGATKQLTELLAREGRVDELRVRTDQGDHYAAVRLADLLAQEGRTGEAIAVLRARADQGDYSVTQRLVELLAQDGRTGEAITVLRARADQGDRDAAAHVADLLARDN